MGDILLKFLPPLLVAVFMFFLNRNQKKRDTHEAELKSELTKKNEVQKKQTELHTKGLMLNMEATTIALNALKKLKDEKGKALLNGELTAINKKVEAFRSEFENFIIEK